MMPMSSSLIASPTLASDWTALVLRTRLFGLGPPIGLTRCAAPDGPHSPLATALRFLVILPRRQRSFEPAHPVTEFAQAPELRCHPLPFTMRQRRKRASVYPRLADRIVDQGGGRDRRA